MINKLEVGMYVRTKYGIIEKIEDVLEFDGTNYYLNSFHTAIKVDKETDVVGNKGKITKASHNIIDLIEVGDIIEYEIKTSLETSGVLKGITDISNKDMLENIKNDNNYTIKKVLTKEQFNQYAYEVE